MKAAASRHWRIRGKHERIKNNGLYPAGRGERQNAGSSGVAEKNLNRWTVIIALLWVAIIIALGLMTKFNLI